MQLILFSILVFGQLFVIRTRRIFSDRAMISQNHLTKIGTGTSTSLVLGAFFMSPLWASAFAIFVLVFFFAILKFMEHRQGEVFRAMIPNFIEAWILNLRLGLAESHAREKALQEMDLRFAKLVRTRLNSPFLRSDSLIFDPLLLKELRDIVQTPHLALQKLECLRSNLKRASDFRRRSGQATRQTRIQSLTMLVLLFALSGVATKRYGWSQVGDLVGFAIILASIGIFIIQLLARKTKWRI